MKNDRLLELLWLLLLVPTIVTLITESYKELLIWHIRIVDFVDLIFLAPFYLFALFKINNVILSDYRRSFLRMLSIYLICMFLYGHSMHLTANAINTYSTEINNYLDRIPSDTYELIFFFDEDLGHWLLFISIYSLIGLWILFSNKKGHFLSAFSCGLSFGIVYAIIMIESSQPWFGFVASLWLLGCSFWKLDLFKIYKTNSISYTLPVFGVSFGVMLLTTEILYFVILGDFQQPSSF